MTGPGLDKYQRKLGTPRRPPHLSLIKSTDLERVEQPDPPRWSREDWWLFIACAVAAALAVALLVVLIQSGGTRP